LNTPLVSIVTATYNRSNVLRYAMESVRASTFPDWELIVVGDACTDDTEQVVQSFDDQRIRFINLETNCGEQSGPNNQGMRLARGRYVAFLNHDDLWLPGHLKTCIREIEQGHADLVFTLALTVDHLGRTHLAGVTKRGVYDRTSFPPASSWLFRRELLDEIGSWQSARSLFLAPSTDWLDRAWKAGRKLVAIEQVTVVAILSGGRRNSYSERQFLEHQRYAEMLRQDPLFLETQLSALSVELTRQMNLGIGRHLRRALKNTAREALIMMRIHPVELRHRVLYRRRGGFIDRLRRTRGLKALPREEIS